MRNFFGNLPRRFGSTQTGYQSKVNSLPGALGPAQPAFWKDTTRMTGKPYELYSHPMEYSTREGLYLTAGDSQAASGSVNFSDFSKKAGFGRRRRSRRTHVGGKRCIKRRSRARKSVVGKSRARKVARGSKVRRM